MIAEIKRLLPMIIIVSFACGLIAQFVWKMTYFPEPEFLVIIEIVGILIIATVGSCLSLNR